MYRNSAQIGYISLFSAGGSSPLLNWDIHVGDGRLSRFLDPELKIMVLDVLGPNVSTTYITCPPGKTELGIYLPFLVMVVKNLKKYFTFEITVRDHDQMKRRFRVANFQSCVTVSPTVTAMPLSLSAGWNQVQFNLKDFVRRAYNTEYKEIVRIKINANIRLRTIYFAQRLVQQEELPTQFRLFYPFDKKHIKSSRKDMKTSPTKVGSFEKELDLGANKIEEERVKSGSIASRGSQRRVTKKLSKETHTLEKIVDENATKEFISEPRDEVAAFEAATEAGSEATTVAATETASDGNDTAEELREEGSEEKYSEQGSVNVTRNASQEMEGAAESEVVPEQSATKVGSQEG